MSDFADYKPVKAILKFAAAMPETEQTTSCNKIAFKARNKAFLYVGGNDETYNLMLKLGDSVDEARLMAENEPENYSLGDNRWVKVVLPKAKSLPAATMKRWIEESFRLLAPKSLVNTLD